MFITNQQHQHSPHTVVPIVFLSYCILLIKISLSRLLSTWNSDQPLNGYDRRSFEGVLFCDHFGGNITSEVLIPAIFFPTDVFRKSKYARSERSKSKNPCGKVCLFSKRTGRTVDCRFVKISDNFLSTISILFNPNYFSIRSLLPLSSKVETQTHEQVDSRKTSITSRLRTIP